MVKKIAKGKEKLKSLYRSVSGMSAVALLTIQAVFAAAPGTSTIWSR